MKGSKELEAVGVSRTHFDHELAVVRATMRQIQWMIGTNTALLLAILAEVLTM